MGHEAPGNVRPRCIAAAVLLLAITSGCETTGTRAYAGGTAAGGRMDPRMEAARSMTRVEQMDAELQRLQVQVDGLSQSQQHVLSQAEARIVQARQESQALRSEIDSLQREVNALKTEQQQLRAAVDDLPARVSRAVAAARPPTPAPAATRARSSAAVGYEHVVEPGQTLSEIARAYGVRMDVIVQENQIRDPASIRAGQKLFIPRP